ncbi:MAG: hypothetical protein K1060chlam4_01247 [Candidatus Anoxychlamydiales bacterium]|nr:hypothetical protein [Candidatus Anoxychlamydiales bacterium]
MPEISRFLGMIIAMYYKEHNPPHFHVRYNEFKATISINDLSLLEGKLPTKVMGLIIEWASINQKALIEDWELAKKFQELKKNPTSGVKNVI